MKVAAGGLAAVTVALEAGEGWGAAEGDGVAGGGVDVAGVEVAQSEAPSAARAEASSASGPRRTAWGWEKGTRESMAIENQLRTFEIRIGAGWICCRETTVQ